MPNVPGMAGGAGGAADVPEDKKNTEIEIPDTLPAHLLGEPDNDLKKRVVDAIREIYDPEIPVNVYDLGLIYYVGLDEETKHVDILMTLTAPNCPAAGILPGQVEDAARMVDGVESVNLELTFRPPFSPEMMSEEAQLELGFM